MTQEFLGGYRLQGCFLSRGSPCPTLAPGPRSAPPPTRAIGAAPCLAPLHRPHAFTSPRAHGNDSDPVARDGACDNSLSPTSYPRNAAALGRDARRVLCVGDSS